MYPYFPSHERREIHVVELLKPAVYIIDDSISDVFTRISTLEMGGGNSIHAPIHGFFHQQFRDSNYFIFNVPETRLFGQ